MGLDYVTGMQCAGTLVGWACPPSSLLLVPPRRYLTFIRYVRRQRSGTKNIPTHAESRSTMSFPYKRRRNAPYRETLTPHAAATIHTAGRTYMSYKYLVEQFNFRI